MSQNCKLEPLNDDTVQCLFFSSKLGSDLQLWQKLCDDINNLIENISAEYIWHRDEFKVHIPLFKDISDAADTICLRSTTCFGENLEDEWFIVYIVFEISKKYNDLTIQIKDNDGDFLLIEAADYLESWANPENTENRVFIHDGHLHIISPKIADLQSTLELTQALKIINNQEELTQASHDIEQAILNRIGDYPKKISENIHRVLVRLPSELAALLTLKPSLISPIVDAYCNHDIMDAKCCKNLEFDDCVIIEVKFTKFLYAALMNSKTINTTKNIFLRESDKKNILGFKLMCGFKIIMNKASGNEPLSSKEYTRFLNNLKRNGYFGDNIEGSREYCNLLDKAQKYFCTIESPVSSNIYMNISEIMASSEFLKVKDTLKHTPFDNNNIVEDNEDWLNIHPDQLNELLNKRYGKTIKFKNNDGISSQNIAQELSSFLKETSDFEGIEPSDKSVPDKIDFESDQFVSCIDKMLKILSTGRNDDTESNEADSDDYSMDYEENDDADDDCAAELEAKLQNDPINKLKDSESVLANIIQSMREEQASTGPSSNLLRSIGLSKNELLDSDDD